MKEGLQRTVTTSEITSEEHQTRDLSLWRENIAAGARVQQNAYKNSLIGLKLIIKKKDF